MAEYREFIDIIKQPDFGGFNAIEYADGGQEVYLSFQALLKWISENINLYSNGEEIIKVDWESNKPMFLYSTSVSCNLQTCYIRNGYLRTTPGTVSTVVSEFNKIDSFNGPTAQRYIDLKNTLDYFDKITQSYGYDKYTGELNEKLFPITKDDKQMKEIVKNIDNYNQALMQLKDYLKQLIKKYNIKPIGNIDKRLAFKLKKDIYPDENSRSIKIVIDNTYFY